MLNRQHGYVVRNGMLDSYDPTPATTLAAIWDINPSASFVGTYRESGEVAAKRHGFLQKPDGSLAITFDFICQDSVGCAGAPFGTVAFATIAFGLDARGVIVGQYSLVNGGAPHGFVALPVDVN
jgi:hypothetical protein